MVRDPPQYEWIIYVTVVTDVLQIYVPAHIINTKKCLSITGKLVASLVREFLEFFHLDFSLAVFEPESGVGVSSTNYYCYGVFIQACNGHIIPGCIAIILHILLTNNVKL